jgi:hypothetical protein
MLAQIPGSCDYKQNVIMDRSKIGLGKVLKERILRIVLYSRNTLMELVFLRFMLHEDTLFICENELFLPFNNFFYFIFFYPKVFAFNICAE